MPQKFFARLGGLPPAVLDVCEPRPDLFTRTQDFWMRQPNIMGIRQQNKPKSAPNKNHMKLLKLYLLIALSALQRTLTAFFIIFTLVFSYFEINERAGFMSGFALLVASSLFFWAGSGLRASVMGGQRIAGSVWAILFCALAYWLVNRVPINAATNVLSMKPLTWGIAGFVIGCLASSRRHLASISGDSPQPITPP